MLKKHLFSLILGIVLIVIGVFTVPIGLYCSSYLSSNFPEVNFYNESQDSSDVFVSIEEQGFFKSLVSKLGLEKLLTKLDNIIEAQKKIHAGYNESFYSIQAEIKYVMKMQAIYIIVTSIIVSIVFIVFGSICLVFHALLVYQGKSYLLGESIRNEIIVYRGEK